MRRINDIFYSLQGEGHHTGRAAVFIRFAGCNLRCSFCDTEFNAFRLMTDEQLLEAISDYPTRFIVLTGGEPTLQVDDALVDLLHRHHYYVAMESNGTRPAPVGIDWLTVSPKGTDGINFRGGKAPDEVKIVFEDHTDPEAIMRAITQQHPTPNTQHPTPRLYLQPCDTGDAARNSKITAACIDYIKDHPQWRLSLQTHKLIGFK